MAVFAFPRPVPQILCWSLLVVLVPSFPRVEPRGRCAQCPLPRSLSVVPSPQNRPCRPFPRSSKVSVHSAGGAGPENSTTVRSFCSISHQPPNGDSHDLHRRRPARTYLPRLLPEPPVITSNHGRQPTSPTPTGGCPLLPPLHNVSLCQPSRLGLLLSQWKYRDRNVGMPKGRQRYRNMLLQPRQLYRSNLLSRHGHRGQALPRWLHQQNLVRGR